MCADLLPLPSFVMFAVSVHTVSPAQASGILMAAADDEIGSAQQPKASTGAGTKRGNYPERKSISSPDLTDFTMSAFASNNFDINVVDDYLAYARLKRRKECILALFHASTGRVKVCFYVELLGCCWLSLTV